MGGFGLRLPPSKSASRASSQRDELFGEEHDEERGVRTKAPSQVSKPSSSVSAQGEQDTRECALEEDSSVFDYDTYYERSQEQRARGRLAALTEPTAPKYMSAMMEAARQRRLEKETARLHTSRQRAQAEGGAETFVTSSYKRKLDEMRQRGVETESKHQADRAESDPPSTSHHLPTFYSNVMTSRLERGRTSRHRTGDDPKPPRSRSRSPH